MHMSYNRDSYPQHSENQLFKKNMDLLLKKTAKVLHLYINFEEKNFNENSDLR